MSSPYITPEGFEILEQELKALWERRADVTRALAAAAAEGDRSENAEYIYRKKELREVDRRIRFLQKRLPSLTVVSTVESEERVYFGAWVTLEHEDGGEFTYRIVGPDEFDRQTEFISVDAPLARAMLGRTVGDEIRVTAAGGADCYAIVTIRYD